jgi:hypothetical protein
MPSLRELAHDGVLCTFRVKDQRPGQEVWSVKAGDMGTVHNVQNHTLLAGSFSASQPARQAAVLGQPSSLRLH